MTFCPCTPESLTKAASYGVIDPSKRVSRAELDRLDRLWKLKQQQQQSLSCSPHTKPGAGKKKGEAAGRARESFDSQQTRVERNKGPGLYATRS